MENEAHDLVHELPEHREKIHELKISNNHFRKLFDKYHDTNKEIHRIEQGVENHADDYTETLKKTRLSLKEELLKTILAS